MVEQKTESKVDEPCLAYKAMAVKWELITDLLGGTEAMRARSTTWLPQEAREESAAYNARLGRSVLYGAYEDGVDKIVAKPFSREVRVSGTVPDRLEDIEDNADNGGNDITQFAKQLFYDAVAYGLTHFLVEYPETKITTETGEEIDTAPTRMHEIDNNIRPYFVHIPAVNMIGWNWRVAPNGEKILTQIRFRESRTEPDGQFGEKQVDYIRVINEDSWELWKKESVKGSDGKMTDEYIPVKQGRHTYERIPLVTYYTQKTGFMTAKPPLEKLAWMNLTHYQVSSDQRNTIRFAGLYVPFAAGFDEDEQNAIVLGVNRLVASTNVEAKFSIVEHSGQAIKAVEDYLDRLESKMDYLSLQPFVQKTGDVTATAKAIDESKSQSMIHAWIRGLENSLYNGYDMGAQWIGVQIQEEGDNAFKIDIFNEFNVTLRASEDLDHILKAAIANKITGELYIREAKRRSVYADNVDPELEAELARSQEGAMPALGFGDNE